MIGAASCKPLSRRRRETRPAGPERIPAAPAPSPTRNARAATAASQTGSVPRRAGRAATVDRARPCTAAGLRPACGRGLRAERPGTRLSLEAGAVAVTPTRRLRLPSRGGAGGIGVARRRGAPVGGAMRSAGTVTVAAGHGRLPLLGHARGTPLTGTSRTGTERAGHNEIRRGRRRRPIAEAASPVPRALVASGTGSGSTRNVAVDPG